MSERKSDEIKFRIKPSVKARWQEAADVDPQTESLSEFIRAAVDEKLQATFKAGVAKAREALDAGPEAVLEFLRAGEREANPLVVISNVTSDSKRSCSRSDVCVDGCTECGASSTELGSACGIEKRDGWKPFGADLVG